MPKALKNISIFSPLSQISKSTSSTTKDKTNSPKVTQTLSQSHNPTYNIQKKSAQDIPNSWSNIAELFDEIQVNSISPKTIIQTLRENNQSYNKPKAVKQIRSVGNDFPNNENSMQFIQASYETFNSADSVQQDNSNSLTNEDSTSEDESKNLDTLAREIYKMLKQRLDIERERRGNNYSGRLPW
ncbi:hypothetical protein [Nostoc piscinale]|uniref:hypothetical protein n=1 Tax=Nostoc piscinale TaxID=224012 RepID=UPI0039A42A0F